MSQEISVCLSNTKYISKTNTIFIISDYVNQLPSEATDLRLSFQYSNIMIVQRLLLQINVILIHGQSK